MSRHSARNPIGKTDLFGQSGISKADLRIQTNGAIDEASASLSLAKSFLLYQHQKDLLETCQAHLSKLMGFVAHQGDKEAALGDPLREELEWLETTLFALEDTTQFPTRFVFAGRTPADGALDNARAVVRRTERTLVASFAAWGVDAPATLTYLNRLSSVCYVLELSYLNASQPG